MAVLEGPRGAVAAALITRQRGGIPDAVEEDMRDSGLAHLLSISGLHMGLVAGLLFFALRAGLALVPAVALYRPIKKWAAVGAARSEEHTSELQSLMRIPYAVFCVK